jgi:two-component system response regulator RegA
MTDTALHYLIIDDDATFACVLQRALHGRGCAALTASDAQEALALLGRHAVDRVILDLKLQKTSSLGLISAIKALQPAIEIVLLTGYSSIATAVEAIKLGAINYLCKPADTDEIIGAFEAASRADAPVQTEPPSVRRLEWEHIQAVLQQHDGNISATARSLGMHRRTLQRKLQKRPARK